MKIDKHYTIRINEQEMDDILDAVHSVSSDEFIQKSDPELTKRLANINLKMNGAR